MRIVLDARTIQDHFPGIGRYSFNLALALADAAPHDELALLHCPTQTNTRFDFAALKTKPNVRVTETDAPNFSLREQWTIPRALRTLRADVYHSPYYIMPYAPGAPTVVTVHDLLPMRYPEYFSAFQRVVFNFTLRLALRAAKKIIAVSNAGVEDLRARLKIPDAQIVVIPEAAAPIFVPSAFDEITRVREKYHLPHSFLFYFGSNKPHKNLVRLIEAFAVTHQQSPLVIAGHWEARYAQAKQRADELNLGARVRWLGEIRQEDLPALYGAATAFVFPSEYEGFGLPVLEALACGTPVICSNASSLPQVANDAALFFDPHDVEAIANAIEKILRDSNLRENLRERGFAQAKKFSWTRAAHDTYQIYEQLHSAH